MSDDKSTEAVTGVGGKGCSTSAQVGPLIRGTSFSVVCELPFRVSSQISKKQSSLRIRSKGVFTLKQGHVRTGGRARFRPRALKGAPGKPNPNINPHYDYDADDAFSEVASNQSI